MFVVKNPDGSTLSKHTKLGLAGAAIGKVALEKKRYGTYTILDGTKVMPVLFALKTSAPPVEPPSGVVLLGDAPPGSGSASETAGVWTISGRGTADPDDGSFVPLATVATGNIQIIARIASLTGTLENDTQAGVMIREAGAAPRLALCAWPNVTRTRGKYRSVTGATPSGGIFGATPTTLPQWIGLTYNKQQERLNFWESEDGSDWNLISANIALALSYPVDVGLYVTSHNNAATATVEIDNVAFSPTITLTDAPPVGARQGIVYRADFASDAIQARTSSPDGAFYKGMGPPLGSGTNVSTSTGGGGHINSTDYSRVVDSSVRAAMVGSRCFRFLLHYNLDYNILNTGSPGPIGGTKDKARTALFFDAYSGGYWNEFMWIGYGTFFPSDWPPETSNAQGSDMPIFELNMIPGNDSAITCAIVRKETYDAADGFGIHVLTQSGPGTGGLPAPEALDLRAAFDMRSPPGGGASMLGRWVPWVWRFRVHNGANGHLKLWVGDQPVINMAVPLGCAPSSNGWGHHLEMYKGNWKKNPSSIAGPLVCYVDECYVGRESEGSGYSEVHPLRTGTLTGP